MAAPAQIVTGVCTQGQPMMTQTLQKSGTTRATGGSSGEFSFGSLLRRPETGAFLGLFFVFVFFTIFGGDQLRRAHGGSELPQRRRQPRHRRAARSAF